MEHDVTSFIGRCLEAYGSLQTDNFQPYKRAQTPVLPEDSLPVVADESEGGWATIALKY